VQQSTREVRLHLTHTTTQLSAMCVEIMLSPAWHCIWQVDLKLTWSYAVSVGHNCINMPVRQQMQTPRSNLTECSQFWLIWYTQTAAVSIGQGGIHKPYVPAYSGINQHLNCLQLVLARIVYTHCMCLHTRELTSN
jgi:hypothetical protein